MVLVNGELVFRFLLHNNMDFFNCDFLLKNYGSPFQWYFIYHYLRDFHQKSKRFLTHDGFIESSSTLRSYVSKMLE